ncbi:MAG TPA: glycosyltransferase family 2 protein [bacterium]|nr:glycosyltransferase family 2 protein [bacterium]
MRSLTTKRCRLQERLWKMILFLFGIRGTKPQIDPNFRPNIVALIPAYNEEKVIKETIESLKNQTYPVTEIIVIDDKSQDRTREIAQEAGAKVITTPYNTGSKARALNYGFSVCKAEIVIIMDADTKLAKDAVEKIIPYFSDPQVYVVGGRVLSWQHHSFWAKVRSVQYMVAFGLVRPTQAFWNSLVIASGCFMAIRGELLRKIKALPEDTISEDITLTWMAHLEGKKVLFVPEAKSYTLDPPNWYYYKHQTLRWARGYIQCLLRFRKRLSKKRGLWFFAWMYFGISIISAISRLLLPLVIYLFVQYPHSVLFSGWIAWILIDFIFASFVVMREALKESLVKTSMLNLPFLLVVSVLDDFLFIQAFIEEVVLRRKPIYIKGH